MSVRVGDTVKCINVDPVKEFADWYMDDNYVDLVLGQLYVVRDILRKKANVGYDVGVPTPWGDNHWSDWRFEKVVPVDTPSVRVKEAA